MSLKERAFIFIIILLLGTANVQAQEPVLVVVGKVPGALKETSSLMYLNDELWSHNDSGGAAALYALDKHGKLIHVVQIKGATNYDWEALTKDNQGNVYIGDLGNNKLNRKTCQIYKIKGEDLKGEAADAELIEFSYPEGFTDDAEAIIAMKGSLYIFSKNRHDPYNGYTRIYSVPKMPGSYEAQLVDSLYMGDGPLLENWITAADISPDNDKIVLLSHNKIHVITNFQDGFSKVVIHTIMLETLTQKEGIAFISNHEVMISDEASPIPGFGGQLFVVKIP